MDPPMLELHVFLEEFFDDVAGVGQRAGETIEFGEDQRVAVADNGQCLAQVGPVPRFVPVSPWSV